MRFPTRAIHRVRQFFGAFGAWIWPVEPALPEGYLTLEQIALFRSMSQADQRHSLAAFHALRREGYDDRDLLVATLLHDIGKSLGPVPLWARVAIVLMEAWSPALLEKLASRNPRSLGYPFFVHREHSDYGAELALRAGCTPKVVNLIKRHHDPEAGEDDSLRALQRADSAN